MDAVLIDGIAVSRGSRVRVHPLRRADAQDLFFEGRIARVTAVLSDVDGGTHVALVLVDDPASDLHEEYGRYLYFAPEELEPLPAEPEPCPERVVDSAKPREQEGGLHVKTLGRITTGFLIAVAVGVAVAGVLSIPDVRRYLQIRSM